jgi:hypothetical protein
MKLWAQGEQAAGHDQGEGEEQAGDAAEQVEHSAFHDRFTPSSILLAF